MTRSIFLLLFVFTGFTASSKSKHKPYLRQAAPEASLFMSGNGSLFAPSLSLNQFWHIGFKPGAWQVGMGLRFTSTFAGNDNEYITSPAYLTSERKGPFVLFSDKNHHNIDTLMLASPQVNILNAFLSIRYAIHKNWEAAFNIDLAGFSFGAGKSAKLIYGESSNATRFSDAVPSPRNLLLIGDNDFGSLNSQLIVYYRLNRRFKISSGFSLIRTEYTINKPVLYTTSMGSVVDTDRFRKESLTFGFGLNYIFTSKNK